MISVATACPQDLIPIEKVITTRSYDDRLDTISAVRDAGISVCSGGIIGLGEADADRVGLIWEVSKLVNLPYHISSFFLNSHACSSQYA